ILMQSQNPKDFSLDELVKWIGDSMPGSTNHTAGMAELTRRQILSQIESTQAQTRAAIAEERAAEAATSTAASTERNARYMRWSVFAAAASALGSLWRHSQAAFRFASLPGLLRQGVFPCGS